MAANIAFLSGDSVIQDMAGSGLGFYGPAGFGDSVDVGDWQDHTFITNGAGTALGPEAWNVKWTDAASGSVAGGSSLNLTYIPNAQATLNIRFTYDTPVQVTNAQVNIYDRSDPVNPASGVSTKLAELIHLNPSQVAGGSGDTAWTTFLSSTTGVFLDLANSPGVSGLYAGNGTSSVRPDTQHDWYVAASASPDSIGSKTLYGLYVQLEYL